MNLTARSLIYVVFVLFAAVVIGLVCMPVRQHALAVQQQDTASDAQAVNDSTGDNSELINRAVARLIEIQEEDGAWPYEGVYRVRRQIPVGYRIGGTAIVCQALLYGTSADHEAANKAIDRGIEIILEDLDHPLMQPSTVDTYDVRVWGHIYALDFFCRLAASERLPEQAENLEAKIDWLLAALLEEELSEGGWNYANRRAHAAFVSAPALQALLWAKSLGRKVPDEVFQRGRDAMLASRNEAGAFRYSGTERESRPTALPGSIARSAACETTLTLLGDAARVELITAALEAFHTHWDELEKRRQKTGTHVGPYQIAPYYFYYGHRYAGQAIALLPEADRSQAYDRLVETLIKTKEDDDTWNDRVFERSRAFGTAFSVMALLGDRVPLPPAESP